MGTLSSLIIQSDGNVNMSTSDSTVASTSEAFVPPTLNPRVRLSRSLLPANQHLSRRPSFHLHLLMWVFKILCVVIWIHLFQMVCDRYGKKKKKNMIHI